MTPTTITVRPHELEPGDILTTHLGQRVGGYDPPSLLLYAGQWHVWSSLDRKICTLPAGVEVEVIRNVADDEAWKIDEQFRREVEALPHIDEASDFARSHTDECSPHGIVRSRGLYVVTP